jgi:flagellar motor protein MotB
VGVCGLCQSVPDSAAREAKNGSAPIFRVTVVERTTKAINYQYRSGPTPIDFRGTVLLPKAKGSAEVNSKQGRTEIEAHFSNLTSPTAFGREYLTYVLWALTPDGRPHNIGEIIPNSLDNSNLRVTTDLQAFAMIVTAEPYSAVRQPSDVVVMENEVRSDTTGIIEQVNARYELLPRGHYSWEVPADLKAAEANGPKVSTREYEELIEIYQAQNAVGVARTAGAAHYAPNTLAKAETLLQEAQQRHARNVDRTLAIQEAREAAETAEDARVIAEKGQQQDKLVQAQAEVNAAQQAKLQADAAYQQAQAVVQQAQAQAQAEQARAEAERDARRRAEEQAQAALDRAAQMQAALEADRLRAPTTTQPQLPAQSGALQSGARMHMLEQLNGIAITRDTPRGLVVIVPDAGFQGTSLRGSVADEVGRVAQVLAVHPDLRVEVEGHSDAISNDPEASRRAQMVADILRNRGLRAGMVSVRSLGDSRPLGSNASPGGREENRRVEIVISGDSIGTMPFWEHPYTLSSQSR